MLDPAPIEIPDPIRANVLKLRLLPSAKLLATLIFPVNLPALLMLTTDPMLIISNVEVAERQERWCAERILTELPREAML